MVVNVSEGDALMLRSRPSASSHGIIHLDAQCTPRNVAWGQRWCPVTHYNGDRTTSGWVKARFVRDSDCP